MAYFECLVGGSGDGSTLTVTCYSGFAGLAISITNGVDTFSDICPSTSPYEVVFDGLANGTWTLSTVYNGDTYTQIVEINSVTQFYPIPDGETVTPTDDIQTWLNCANIFDKNYTLLSQVLSDASTLQALIASNNAADYMARSTSWANSVTTNANAMIYIGANDYCATKLLANSTWRDAICNSAYFESVLNVKVPVMTSNTAPSGVVSSSGTYGGQPYLAFDNNNNTKWYPMAGTNGTSGTGWIDYQFSNQIDVYLVIADSTCSGSPVPNHAIELSYSSDGNNYSSVSTITNSNFISKWIIPKTTGKNFRLTFNNRNIKETNSYYYIQETEIKIYGRA